MKTITLSLGRVLLVAAALFFSFLSYAASPILTITCPPSVVIEAASGECGAYLDFNALQWGSTSTLVDTTFNPGPGHFFELGPTAVSLAVITSTGQTETCAFIVTVEEWSNSMACDDIQVGFQGQCTREISFLEILYPNTVGCTEGMTLAFLSPGTGAMVPPVITTAMIGQTLNAKVTSGITGQSCWGSVNIEDIDLPPSIACPPDTTMFCHQDGDPTLTGGPLFIGCYTASQIGLQHFDVRTNSYCDGDNIAFHIQRTWQATNPSGNVMSCTQDIDALRITFADVQFPPDLDNMQLSALACGGLLTLAEKIDTSRTGIPLVAGEKLDVVTCDLAVYYEDSILNDCGANYILKREWTVFDFCLSESITHVQTIVVADDEAPVFTIPDTIYVSLNAECGMVATLPDFDALDDCSMVAFEIQTPWDTLLTDGGEIEVPAVAGFYEAKYVAVDACGNVAEQTAIVKVSDEVISACPPDHEITSDFYLEKLKVALDTSDYSVLVQFGRLASSANCDLATTESLVNNLNDCDEGTLVRTMEVDSVGLSCVQQIMVHHVSDFIVEFPADITVNCGVGPWQTGDPKLVNVTGEHIAVTHEDQLFTVVPDACFKVVRTWTVFNTCVTGSAHDQEVIEQPENQMGMTFPNCDLDGDGDCDNRTFRDSWRSGLPANEKRPTPLDAARATVPDTDPDSDPWDGYVRYQQVIKVSDTVDPVFTNGCQLPDVFVADTSCFAMVVLPTQEVGDCSTTTLTAQFRLGGVWYNGFGPYVNVPVGTYEVHYTALDACNNSQLCTTTVKVKDNVLPMANCKGTLVVELMNTVPALVQIWATDFNDGSTDNCTGNLKYSFSPNVMDLGKVYYCCQTGQHPISLYVTDASGNQDSCHTSVIVQQNLSGCDCDPQISGIIETPEAESVNAVQVTVDAIGGTFSATVSTGADGVFSRGAPFGGDYVVTPIKDLHFLNGVTTFDALLLSKHILGTQLLGTPYKLIAADVNNSGAITTADAVEIRKAILQLTTSFLNNTSWRFVPADYSFLDPLDPFPEDFPETILVNDFEEELSGVDFIAIKIGDLNGSADPQL